MGYKKGDKAFARIMAELLIVAEFSGNYWLSGLSLASGPVGCSVQKQNNREIPMKIRLGLH